VFKQFPEMVSSAKSMGMDIESLSYYDFCNGTVEFFREKNIVKIRGEKFHVGFNVYNLFSSLFNYKNRAMQIVDCSFRKFIYRGEGLNYVACQACESDILS